MNAPVITHVRVTVDFICTSGLVVESLSVYFVSCLLDHSDSFGSFHNAIRFSTVIIVVGLSTAFGHN